MNARSVSKVTGRLGSWLFADVDRRDAKRERRPAYVGEAGRAHPGRKLFFGREFGDRLRKISIGSAVATQGSADQRQHAMKIEVIENAHQRLARRCELEDHEASSPLEHAMQLAERGVEITHIANAKRDDRASGASWCQWQL